MEEYILEELSKAKDPMSSTALAHALELNKRTVLRYLNTLVDAGQVLRVGQGRATVYQLADSPVPDSYLYKPAKDRKYVGYNHEFLADYEPNQTTYLDEKTRKKLDSLGQLSPSNEPAGTYARKILDRLLIDLSWNSSRLEGNTYSLLETERLLMLGEPSTEKEAFETQMILNHKAAIEYLVDAAETIDFDRASILNLHALLSDFLLHNPMDSGRLRRHAVGISGSVFLPLDNPYLLEEYFNEILSKAREIENPFEQSFFALVHLPYLQPFADVNKRVARIAANIPFIKANLSPLSFLDVDPTEYAYATLAVYELNDVSKLRTIFLDAYDRSVQRYQAVMTSIGPPNRLKLKYRLEIKDLVQSIIIDALPKAPAETRITEFTKANIPEADQSEFERLTLQELYSVHEGNYARFKVRPSEFQRWITVWQDSDARS